MKKNYLPKRNCSPLPGNPAHPFTQQFDSRSGSTRARSLRPVRPPKGRGGIGQRIVLSVSDDREFDMRLRGAALAHGQIVIRVDSVEAALRIIHTGCSGAVLLDLDFAGKSAWELAGGLLDEPKCPPVILLTGQGEQFDLRMAVMAGSIFDKSAEPSQLLKNIGELLQATAAEKSRRSMEQQGIVRRFKPLPVPAPLIPARRFCGINE
jgi:FixJ family two-component response regulator